MSTESSRVRREPPAFGEVVVARTEQRSPFLVRVTLQGTALHAFEPPLPAGSVRLLLPDEPGAGLVMPAWDGNAFRHVDGRRPVIRTLTPLRHDEAAGELDIEVVLHGHGPLSAWAAARAGDPAAFSGPGRGYTIETGATDHLVAGDESAIPAIGQVVEALPAAAGGTVIVEIGHPDARIAIRPPSGMDVRWVVRPAGASPGEALAEAVAGSAIGRETRVWVAGEAAAMQRIRRHLFVDLGLSRSHATVRGYWKHGRSGGDDDG